MSLDNHIKTYIQNHFNEFNEIVHSLYNNPELGNKEFKSCALLSDFLENKDFTLTRSYVLPTAFKAVYHGKCPGFNIAFLCEYDALPGIGHGCGHNMISAISIAAACACKKIVDEVGGSIYVFGTPAEECDGGKVYLSKANAFDKMDAALMIHPDTLSRLGAKTLALNPVRFEFYGKNAHACECENANSALDAAVLSYTGINMLRQFAKKDTFIHGIFKDGGKAANIIPDYACLDYYFRAPSMSYAKVLSDKAEACVRGACEATGCTYKRSIYECPYEDNILNFTLCNMLKEEYNKLNVEDIVEIDDTYSGSSDIGSVSYKCPSLHGYIKIADTSINGHSREFAQATISPKGEDALYKASIALAQIARRLLCNKEEMNKVKQEFYETHK